MHLLVLEAVTDVDSSELVGTFFVVELISRPVKASNQHSVATFVSLDVPAALRCILLNAFKEVSLESCLCLFKISFLAFTLLYIAEVHVAV